MTETGEALRRLVAAASELPEGAQLLLARMADALRAPIVTWLNEQSDLLDAKLSEAISNQLLLHHATHEERLNKKAFEYVLKYAFEAVGVAVYMNPDPTNAAEDLRIRGTSFSLKTQADSGIKRGSIYIQKLMEARWIRDFASRDDLAREAIRRISAHLSEYERILVLKAYPVVDRVATYELVEIPKTLFMRVSRLGPSDFSEKNKYGSSGADVRDDQGIAFRVLLDGSVEKVRVFNLRADRCVRHAEWKVPVAAAATPPSDE